MPAFHVSATTFVRGALVAIGVTGAVLGASYVSTTYIHGSAARDEGLIPITAMALSSEVVDRTLRDKQVQRQLADFGLKVLKHPQTVGSLKEFFIHELTDDTDTRAALKKFVVDEVILDSWVREELINVVKEQTATLKADADVFPNPILHWLGDGAINGITTKEFKCSAMRAIMMALWDSIIGPPSADINFDSSLKAERRSVSEG